LAILVDFQDNWNTSNRWTHPFSVSDVRSLMRTTSSFFWESSYGQMSLTSLVDFWWWWHDASDVRGWYGVPINSAEFWAGFCAQNGDGNLNYAVAGLWLSQLAYWAKALAQWNGVDVSAYDRFVYFFPWDGTTWCPQAGGRGTVGGSETWISGLGFQSPNVLPHEMGHNLGLWHSHALACDVAAAPYVSCPSWARYEYGDSLDLMGNYGDPYPLSTTKTPHFNAFQKERLGWLDNGAPSPPITTVTTDGVYFVEPMETTPGGWAKALKILRYADPSTGAKTWYYVEYRQAIGFDGFLATAGPGYASVPNGVVVHLGTDGNANGNTSWLLDMTGSYTCCPFAGGHPTLDAGQSYTDPSNGMTITTLWAGPTTAAVSVSFSPPVQPPVPVP
jgi:hypothetical protein